MSAPVHFDEGAATTTVSCYDDVGASVAFWLALKFPNSYAYLFIDPSHPKLTETIYSMDSPTNGALAHTLKQLWSSGMEYIIFNDEPVTTPQSTRTGDPNVISGHTKGVLGWSSSKGTGFWLTHSTPLFPIGPDASKTYQGLNDSSHIYGQDFYCMSMNTTELNSLASLLTLNAPDIYSSYVSTTTQGKYPGIKALYLKEFVTTAECKEQLIGNVTIFAKTTAWNQDLWDGCVAPYYKTPLYVESWLRGDEIGPACPPAFKYTVLDIDYLNFGTHEWKETQDHSKWAVSTSSKIPLVCFGDINRMTSQYLRGGGTTCFLSASIWAQLYAAVTSHNACPTASRV